MHGLSGKGAKADIMHPRMCMCACVCMCTHAHVYHDLSHLIQWLVIILPNWFVINLSNWSVLSNSRCYYPSIDGLVLSTVQCNFTSILIQCMCSILSPLPTPALKEQNGKFSLQRGLSKHETSRIIKDYQGLSRIIKDYHGLSRIIKTWSCINPWRA